MRYRLSLYALSILVAVGALWAYSTPIDITLHARGVVRPQGGSFQIVAETGGRITEVGAREGASVHRDDVLVQFDDRDLRLKERALLNRIRYSEQRLADPRQRLDGIAEVAEETSLRAAVSGARFDLEECRLELSHRTVTSPIDGRITVFTPLKPGESMNPGAAVAVVVPDGHPEIVEAWVPSTVRPFIASGQAVRMQLESVPNSLYRAFDGVIATISPDAAVNRDSGIGAYRVTVEPSARAPALELGMTLQVHFITREERLLGLLFHKIRSEFESE